MKWTQNERDGLLTAIRALHTWSTAASISPGNASNDFTPRVYDSPPSRSATDLPSTSLPTSKPSRNVSRIAKKNKKNKNSNEGRLTSQRIPRFGAIITKQRCYFWYYNMCRCKEACHSYCRRFDDTTGTWLGAIKLRESGCQVVFWGLDWGYGRLPKTITQEGP